jgi:hypothetical protein
MSVVRHTTDPDVKSLSVETLLTLLPTEKIRKSKDDDVQIARSALESAVLEELWDRHRKGIRENLEAAVFAPGSTLCPRQEPDKLLFIDEVLTLTRDALFRLAVRGDHTARGSYDSFGNYLWRVTLNKALDLRRELSGERPSKRKAIHESSADPNAGASQRERPTGAKPIPVSLEALTDVAASPDRSLDPVVIDIRAVLETYYNEAPERAASLKVVFDKEVYGWTWEDLAALVPGERSIEAKKQQVRRFSEKDIRELEIRLKDHLGDS